MKNPAILYPMFLLCAWTALVLMLVPIARFRAGFRGDVRVKDFRYGESQAVPGAVSIPNRNYMNLLELPVLFYVACLTLYVTGTSTTLALVLAWAFVALRIVHSAIHLTYNNVMHRLAAFAASATVLVALWVVAFAAILDQSQT